MKRVSNSASRESRGQIYLLTRMQEGKKKERKEGKGEGMWSREILEDSKQDFTEMKKGQEKHVGMFKKWHKTEADRQAEEQNYACVGFFQVGANGSCLTPTGSCACSGGGRGSPGHSRAVLRSV